MQPGHIIEVLKGAFGLSTSPKWWLKLSGDLKNMTVVFENKTYKVEQNVINPCVFQFIEASSDAVSALLLTHVDGLMLMGPPGLVEHLRTELKKMFPVEDWEENQFEYVGCEYGCKPDRVDVKQKVYANNRAEKVNLSPSKKHDDLASAEQSD